MQDSQAGLEDVVGEKKDPHPPGEEQTQQQEKKPLKPLSIAEYVPVVQLLWCRWIIVFSVMYGFGLSKQTSASPSFPFKNRNKIQNDPPSPLFIFKQQQSQQQHHHYHQNRLTKLII